MHFCRYRWLKDGVPIDERTRPNVQFLAENSIRILSATIFDDGLYTCQASNDLGTAVSNEARLLMAVLGSFPRPGREERLYSVDEYSPLRLSCNRPVSLPNATFSWVLAKRAVDDRPLKIVLSKRIQIDPVTGGDRVCFSIAVCLILFLSFCLERSQLSISISSSLLPITAMGRREDSEKDERLTRLKEPD